MTAVEAGVEYGAADLSCFTANLASYQQRTRPDALAWIARSVRLAVRTDLVAFSHHATGLDRLADGRVLAYRGVRSPAELTARLDRELAADGAVLIVGYAGAMAWSVAGPEETAPHFVLLDQHHGDRWHVVDVFSALLPNGRQEPFAGPIGTDELLAAMTPGHTDQVHRLRRRYAFGVAVGLPPDEHYQWLSPTTPVSAISNSEPDWRTGLAALDWLAEFFAGLAEDPERERFVDDIWAAAQHHAFRYAHLAAREQLPAADRELVAQARQAWLDLPMALRFAANSARRGRARPALLRTTFDQLRATENRCAGILAAHGYHSAEGKRDPS